MKRYIRSSWASDGSWQPEFEGKWTDDDKELWRSIDWKARNYEDFIVEDDTFEGEIIVYGLGDPEHISTTFVKRIPPNPIYSIAYEPADKNIVKKKFPNISIVGPMYDGESYDGYHVLNRYETYALYDQLSR